VKKKRESLAHPESLEAILDRAGENRFAKARPPIDERVWREAVGARIADRVQPLSLRDGVLLLRVPSSVWAHELSLLADHVCARVRERGLEVRELRFRVGTSPIPRRAPEPRVARTVPTMRALPRDLTAVLGAVRDQELRDSIARAAAANLAWQSLVPPEGAPAISGARRAVRAPRASGEETCPPDRTSPASRGAGPGTTGGGRDRSR
jgi:predicted nucleic acid-binding Zn ribbon protein